MTTAVLTYKDSGSRGAGGQTVGANGAGKYAVIFDSETSGKARQAAIEYIRDMDRLGPPRLSEIHIVSGDGYFGPLVKKISV